MITNFPLGSKFETKSYTYLFFVLLLALFPLQGNALSREQLQKVPVEIYEQIKLGKEKNLFVVFDTTEIDNSLLKQQRKLGLNHYDDALLEQMVRRFKALKNQVFPNGRLADAYVLRDFSHVEEMYVKVPNLKSLEAILKDRRVKQLFFADAERKLKESKELMFDAQVLPETFRRFGHVRIGPIFLAPNQENRAATYELKNFHVFNTKDEISAFNEFVTEKNSLHLSELDKYSYFIIGKGSSCADDLEVSEIKYEPDKLTVKVDYYFTENVACTGDMNVIYYLYRAEKSILNTTLHADPRAVQ